MRARLLSLLVFAFSLSSPAWARPEYALKEKLQCAACHATPWGGGPRLILGKDYGSHGATPAPTSQQDVFYGDLRTISYFPFDRAPERTHSLVALMEAAVTGDVAISAPDSQIETRGVLTYQMSPLANSQAREAYVRFRFGTPEESLSHLLIGHFYVPFGLLTDEHRTYTRIQTNMTFNNFDEGLAFEYEPSKNTSLALALVNDFQSGGALSTTDFSYGIVANFRWNPVSLPFLLGLSGNYEHTVTLPEPIAGSLYAGLSWDQITGNQIKGTLLFESVLARNWNQPAFNTGLINPSLDTFFVPSSAAAYAQRVAGETSLGLYGQAKFNLTPRFVLLYKFDYLALDTHSLGDAYIRHGAGFETYFGSNLILNLRAEFASTASEAAGSDVLAAQNDILAMFRLWL